MNFKRLDNDNVVEVMINYTLAQACGDTREHIEENILELKNEAKLRGIKYEEALKKALENKNMLEKISTDIYSEHFDHIEEWEFVPRNHFGGFIFGEGPILPVNSQKNYFEIKYENKILFLQNSRKKFRQILSDAEKIFKRTSNEENYFVIDYTIRELKRVERIPLKAVGEKAEILLKLLNKFSKKQFVFNYNSHGVVNIIRQDGHIFGFSPNFEDTPFLEIHCLSDDSIKDFIVDDE